MGIFSGDKLKTVGAVQHGAHLIDGADLGFIQVDAHPIDDQLALRVRHPSAHQNTSSGPLKSVRQLPYFRLILVGNTPLSRLICRWCHAQSENDTLME